VKLCESQKELKIVFTLASDLATRNLVAVAIIEGHFYPWTFHATQSAISVGQECSCGHCHNCMIFEVFMAGATVPSGSI
jgi:hypothetical protein